MQTTHNPFSADFLTKISAANRLYKEAFFTLVPEEARPHLVTIDQECHALLAALCTSVIPKNHTSSGEASRKSNVKKVDIE